MRRAFFVPAPYFIVGPTAVGKTDLAMAVAELCGAEIVSADAFQVYAGLEHLTAKPSAETLARVRHHLIGHVPRDETYSVARYHEEAVRALQTIAGRGRPAIVVGGSGLYVKALTHGLSPLPPAQPELRAELEKTTLTDLLLRLEALDPPATAAIDRANKRRVVRALEVCIATGGRFSDHQNQWRETAGPIRATFLIRDKDDLHARIEQRTLGLMSEEALGEAREALGGPISLTCARVLGFADTKAMLDGDFAPPEFLERVRTATRQYAKRQLTWFRGEEFAHTVNLSTAGNARALVEIIAAAVMAA